MKKLLTSKFLLMLLLIGAMLVFVACGSSDDDATGDDTSEGTSEDANDAPAAEGGELVIATLSEAVALDPHGSNDTPSSNVAYNIYEQLVVQDENMDLQPGLATSWEMIEDTVWEFYLEEGVTFHDGTPFNAEVVKANIDRILDEAVASPRSFLFNMINEVIVVDEYTVQFVTDYSFAPLPAHLAHNGGGMISQAVIEADYEAMADGGDPGATINDNPTGTGPFKLDYWNSGDEMRLVKNEDYWGEPALLDSIVFRVVPEDGTRIADLETNVVHISDPLSPSDVSRIENTEGIFVNRTPSVSLSYIGFNVQKEPFTDVRVRQAISMAINKDAIINDLYGGAGIPAIGPIAPAVFGFDDSIEGIEYDVEAARELLAEAGYADGFDTTIWTNDSRERIDAATVVQDNLSELGINVDVQIVEWGAYLDDTAAGEHDMFILGWSTVTGDADYGMYPMFHSDNHGTPGNRTFIANDELDRLLLEARQNPDPDERQALYSEAQQILVEEAPMLYIHHQEFLIAVSEDVQGLWQHPTGILMLKDVSLAQ